MFSVLFAGVIAIGSMAEAEGLPIPPVPPTNQPLDHAAPVPNIDARAPVVAQSEGPTVDVRLYRARTYDSSVGFVPGSRYQSSEDRKPIQTPGFVVSVPLK